MWILGNERLSCAALEVLPDMARSINTQNLLCVQLLNLRRHFNGCKQCRAARIGRDYDELCEYAKTTLIEVSVKWDNNIAGRLAARNSSRPYIFPCPDPNAHGPAYALTVEACVVSGHAEALF
jgi:hypothetical protein